MSQTETRRRQWYVQRISAMVLACCVVAHLAIMIYAVRGGLSGAEILERTQGSWLFGAFYAVFVLGCAAHVPVGVSNIAEEWFGVRGFKSVLIAQLFTWGILILGLRAVWGVIAT